MDTGISSLDALEAMVREERRSAGLTASDGAVSETAEPGSAETVAGRFKTLRVVVLGVTRAGEMLCIGGLSDRFEDVRLKRVDRIPFWPVEAGIQVGDVLELSCARAKPVPDSPHHREDHWVYSYRRDRRVPPDKLAAIVTRSGRVVRGPEPWVAFRDGDRRGPFMRLSEEGSWIVPKGSLERMTHSVAFWRPSRALTYADGYYWQREGKRPYRIRYVGVSDPAPIIPAGRLVRLSTSRFFRPIWGSAVQLSGWFA